MNPRSLLQAGTWLCLAGLPGDQCQASVVSPPGRGPQGNRGHPAYYGRKPPVLGPNPRVCWVPGPRRTPPPFRETARVGSHINPDSGVRLVAKERGSVNGPGEISPLCLQSTAINPRFPLHSRLQVEGFCLRFCAQKQTSWAYRMLKCSSPRAHDLWAGIISSLFCWVTLEWEPVYGLSS